LISSTRFCSAKVPALSLYRLEMTSVVCFEWVRWNPNFGIVSIRISWRDAAELSSCAARMRLLFAGMRCAWVSSATDAGWQPALRRRRPGVGRRKDGRTAGGSIDHPLQLLATACRILGLLLHPPLFLRTLAAGSGEQIPRLGTVHYSRIDSMRVMIWQWYFRMALGLPG